MLNKRIFLESQQCLTKGWHIKNKTIEIPLTQADQFRINEGIEIGKMARALYPHGILINEGNNSLNHKKTLTLINNDECNVIFEGTFIHHDIIAKADILERVSDGWHLIEVKSSSQIKDELLDDLAYTALILKLCGMNISQTSLMLVSKEYQIGLSPDKYFSLINCTEAVHEKSLAYQKPLEKISQTVNSAERPKPTLIHSCKDCDFFEKHCVGKNISSPIFNLPNLRKKKFNHLIQQNIFSIKDIPDEFELTANQKTVWEAVKENKPILNKEKMLAALNGIVFPAYYLDFESVTTPIPLYDKIAPYQEIVTQYSIHQFFNLSDEGKHYEYLADHSKDDRKAIAEKLLKDIGEKGSVIVYHAQAEKRFIGDLIKACPELAEKLTKIIERIVDLKVILNESYYHPDFHGSYSIKVVLPVLIPEMSYKELAIGDGQTASSAFAELARGKYSADETREIRENLLLYCKQDTFAMVKIHRKLLELVNSLTK